MRLKDVKISTQLKIGFGVIMVLLLMLAALAWVQSDALFQQTKGLYEHPLTVRRALGALEVDIVSIRGEMNDLVGAVNDQQIAARVQAIDAYQQDAMRQFDVLRDRYLGPPADVLQAYDEFVSWGSSRAETIRLLREGRRAEASARTATAGAGGAQVAALLRHTEMISDFAKQRGDAFYRAGEAQIRRLNIQLGIGAAVILLLTLLISWYLLKRIKDPLTDLTAATERFGEGDMEARSGYVSANEFGMLAASFNTMAGGIQTQAHLDESAAQLAAVMLREDELHTFCGELLKALVEHTGSQVGAVYFLNEEKTAFEHFESIGLGAGGRAAFSAVELEGELGAAVATRRIQHITDIPADTRFSFVAVTGELAPREILTIPILSDHSVSAVISLAGLRAYSAADIRLVNEIWSVLTARLNGVLAFREIQELAEKLEHQNQELEAQKRELTVQGGELTEQNTELEMQKRELDEANRLKSVFLSNMSHELRTPLNSVIALSGVLNRRLQGAIPAEEYGYLDVIERNGRNLLALINDILDLSRIEAGHAELTIGRFALRDLAVEIVEMLEPQAQEKHIALMQSVPADLPPIASDLAKCRHILQNLVGNAVKFTEQGRVEIAARRVGDELHIAVTDTGIGIAADQLPLIFDEFRQADDGTSRRYGGTGLGLSIAKKYALLLEGGISVESTPGEGSTFTLRLPMALEALGDAGPAEAPAPRRAAGGRAAAPSGQGRRILLVEDSEPAVIQMIDILETQGYRVLVARNGKEALEQIGDAVPDAMILDLMMPEVDGFEVLKAIRGVERTSELPVLILTAKHVTPDELSFLKGNNVHQLIQKGDISGAGLLKVVGEMVAPRGKEPAPLPDKPAPMRRRPAHAGRPVVLVVEDDPDSRRTARALLEGSYRVLEAQDGRAGVERARVGAPDLILMDIAMPVMDGVQALAEIRADEALRHIPVIAVTASAMTGDREAILAHGFDGYISKPIDEEVLTTTLQEVLE
jgi:signal transduction histidine kinase/DNA-binding response OmpR family regulator